MDVVRKRNQSDNFNSGMGIIVVKKQALSQLCPSRKKKKKKEKYRDTIVSFSRIMHREKCGFAPIVLSFTSAISSPIQPLLRTYPRAWFEKE
jgi:hypothetical protein